MGGSKKRRRPWRARVTDGWEFDEEKGKAVQKFRVIGYFATKKEALQALADFHRVPVAPGTAQITFADVYDLWRERALTKLTLKAVKGYDTCFKHSEPLHGMRMHDIRADHMQAVMDAMPQGYATQVRTRMLWCRLFSLALERDVVQKDYASFVRVRDGAATTETKTPFTKAQIATLWDRLDLPGVDLVLISIYTGVRPSELLSIDREHVHLADRWIDLHGTKTKAARRAVPIHRRIVPLIENRLGPAHLATNAKGNRMTYVQYLRSLWNPSIIDALGFVGLSPHSTRHTAISIMTDAGIDDRTIKLIVGHSLGSVTGDVYTHAYVESLIQAIDRLD